jgi:acetylornithine deacetylase
VCDEEYASMGTSSLVERWHADAAIVTEPTGLEAVCTAHKGFLWLELETEGVAAHGSLPAQGVDAIMHMGHVLVALDKLGRQLVARPAHPLLGHGSLHAALIDGGQELSSYPERCRLSVERRTIPGETRASVEAELRAALAEASAAVPNLRAGLRATLERQPFEIAPEAEIVRIVRGQAGRQRGALPAVQGAFGWMDSALLAAAGIPTVIYGPGGAGAHAAVEWADLDELEQCVAILVATAGGFCA